MSVESHGVALNGLDGANPLAFLAALGTLRTLTLALAGETVRMSWEQLDGAWRPRVWSSLEDGTDLVSTLAEALTKMPATHPVMVWQAWMSKKPDDVRNVFRQAAKSVDAKSLYTAAIGSDAAPPSQEEGIADNPFRAARTDYFIDNLKALIERCTLSHLTRTLLAAWDYADAMENQSLRLDATDDRRHAYQWSAPTRDDTRKKRGTMVGDNRLAIESYVYFQSCMSGKSLATVGFGAKSRDRRPLRWPIWNVPIPSDLIPTVLGLAECWGDADDDNRLQRLRSRGVAVVYESFRIKVGDSNPRTNFTPADAV